jgi:purine nucleosidase
VVYWLVGAFLVAILMLVVVFLIAAYRVGPAKPLRVPPVQAVPRSERSSVIYDCDVTMGRPFRDVGDGLALLYLLGEPRVDLRLVTTTYGNGPVEMTTHVTRRLLSSLGCETLDVLPGAAGPHDLPQANEAAQHLTKLVNQAPGEIVLVATGSLTNLGHAVALDPGFFSKLRGFYLWGGATEPLTWHGRRLGERNLSLDPEAAHLALHAECPVTIAPGQAGLSAIFRSPQFAALQAQDDPVSKLIARQVRLWFAMMRLWFRDDGFGMWDSLPAVALTHPELFEFEQVFLTSTREELRTGRLFLDPSRHGPARLVRQVRDFDGFYRAHLAAWRRLGQQINAEGTALK